MTKIVKWAVYNLTFPTQYHMCSSLLRFQEYYESPRFRGKQFGLEQYMDWYASSRDGVFSYFDDWGGFNFPGYVLDHVNDFENYPLGVKEGLVFSSVRAHSPDLRQCYVIGTVNGKDDGGLAHEMCHALYYLNPQYAKRVRKLIKARSSALSPLYKWMKETAGYHSSVHSDEVNAYCCTGYPDELYQREGDTNTAGLSLHKAFCSLFEDEFGFPVDCIDDESWVRKRTHTIPMKTKINKIKWSQ